MRKGSLGRWIGDCKRFFINDPSLYMLLYAAEVENRGVAPFYHNWTAELHAGEKIAARFNLRGILPGESVTWSAEVEDEGPFRLRVPNPMPEGKPLRFANKEHEGEWLVLP